MSYSSKKKTKTSSSRSKVTLRSLKEEFKNYKAVTERFAKEVENIDYQIIATVPAVKEINGVEQPAGVTVSELLAMAKMARVSNRALCIGASPTGRELTIVSVLKRPMVPREIKPSPFWTISVADKEA